MRVFVAGATGAVGRPLVRRLVESGHTVTGMTRDEGRAEELRRLGADAAVCDVFDPSSLEEAVSGSRPEVVIHQLTALPKDMKISRWSDPYPATNRVRTEGTRNLLAAARRAGAGRFVAQSIAFLYDPEGDQVKDEDAAVMSNPPKPFDSAIAADLDGERQVTGAADLEGLVLRFGFFYGPETYYAPDGTMARMARKRQLPIVGDGTGMASFIHVEDAAGATIAASERGPSGVYNVVDDEPAENREWIPVFCEAIGAPKPRRVPTWLARLVAGPFAVEMSRLRGASNAKAKRELGWAPRIPSWRQGFREALG